MAEDKEASFYLTSPLSLQDMCALHITLRWEEFPLQFVSDLPLGIRRNLICSLPLVDVLNVEATPVSEGVDLNFEEIRETIITNLFSSPRCMCEVLLCLRFCTAAADNPHDHYPPDYLIGHIASCYPSLEPTVIKRKYNTGLVLFPSRALQYISINGEESVSLIPSSVEPLLQYCKLMRTKHVKIDCFCFAGSVIWKDYLGQAGAVHHSSNPGGGSSCESSDGDECRSKLFKKKNHTLPSLQQFLSGVETLELGITMESILYCTDANKKPNSDETKDISYVIMHNIAKSHKPGLKHLEIFGMPNATSWVLAGVTKLLCDSTCVQAIALESISLVPNIDSECSKLFDVVSDIASNLRAIVAIQMQNLNSVTAHKLGFHCNFHSLSDGTISKRRKRYQRRLNVQEYKKLLSLLVTFLKQPQMQLVDVGICPSPEAYQLIEAFLCSSTSIEQQLILQVVDDSGPKKEEESEKEESTQVDIHDLMESLMPPISQPIPKSSARFKCLDIHILSSGRSIAWLLNLPELKLKRLKFCAYYLPLVSAHTDVQIEHITFNFFGELIGFYNTSIFPNHLWKFLTSNQALKSLEIVNPTGPNPSDPLGRGIYPVLNHCLSALCRQGRVLEEIYMKFVEFYSDDDTKEFLTIARDLSHQCGTTLVLYPTNSFFSFSEEQVDSLLPALREEFQEKKIKKIVLKKGHYFSYSFEVVKSQLQMITEDVIVRY